MSWPISSTSSRRSKPGKEAPSRDGALRLASKNVLIGRLKWFDGTPVSRASGAAWGVAQFDEQKRNNLQGDKDVE
jgi:hypothetical protein